jgi:MtrB/PioB family decaheme-associated outer membrane protein
MIAKLVQGPAPVAALLLGALPAMAAEPTPEAPLPATGWVDYGLGYVSDSSYGFGRYNGLEDEGLYPVLSFETELRPGRRDYLRARGSNLGVDARSLSVRYGRQGLFSTFLRYDQLPHLRTDSAVTPFAGAGGDTLTDSGTLNPLSLETERKRLAAGLSYQLRPRWKVNLALRQEKKDGTDWVGGAIQGGGGGGGGAAVGQTDSALLPEPIDQTTTDFDASLEYNGGRSQWRLGLQGSFYDNEHAFLRWETPAIAAGATAAGAPGQLALPPDNHFLQFTLSGSQLVSDTTRLTGLFSAGLMEQDDAFLPYTVAGVSPALPRSSLDGEVWVYAAQLGVTARPVQKLRLNAKYRYDERDNQTPQASYDYVRLDSGTVIAGVTNEPLSYRKHRVDVDANYRFSSEWRGLLGYEFLETERTFSDVERNREHTVSGGLKWRPRDDFDAALRVSAAQREASAYQAEIPNQNPLLRKYYLADRDRLRGGVVLSYMPSAALSIGLSADLLSDDYPDTALGLTEANGRIYGVDLSYQPSEDTRWHAFYSRDEMESRQLGSQAGGVADWLADFDDTVDTIGLGGEFTGLWPRWDLAVDYLYSQGRGDITQTASVYPTLENDLHRLQLAAAYRWSKATQLRLVAIYERLDATDWALDGAPLVVGGGGGGGAQALLLGNDSEDYDVVAFMFALRHRF